MNKLTVADLIVVTREALEKAYPGHTITNGNGGVLIAPPDGRPVFLIQIAEASPKLSVPKSTKAAKKPK